jgi:cytochrome P450
MDPYRPVVIDPTGADIHAEAERIHANGPVARIELPGGEPAWSITGYAEARAALSDPRFSKDPRKHWTDFAEGRIGPDFPLIAWAAMENLTTTHGDDHARLRRLIAGAFTARRVASMRPTVTATAVTLLDDLNDGAPDEPVDIKERFAQPLATRVISDLLGVPPESSASLLAGGRSTVDTTMTPDRIAAAMARVRAEMGELVQARRAAPQDDLTSDLIAMQEEDGSRLTDTELVGTLLLLLSVGTEPVTNLVTNTVHRLLVHPEQRRLVDAGEATWRDAIEEALRTEAPVAHLPFRFAVEGVEIGGVTIGRGEPVLVNFGHTGRDPRIHGREAGRYDITRPDKSHLAFGHGFYRCIGMPLAWLEAEIAVQALLERFPGLALAVEPELLQPQGTFIMNGLAALPVYVGAQVPAGT